VTPPVKLAIVNDFDVVVAGLAEMLHPYDERVQVVELDVRTSTAQSVDIALYDTFSAPQVDGTGIDRLLDTDHIGAVVAYTWNMHEALIAEARRKGVRGYLSKSLTAEDLVAALERIAAGESVVEPPGDVGRPDIEVSGGAWPGQREGLSPRQAEIVALLTQGYSNEEIARRSYLSVNTVKSYLRLAYQSMGVSSRSQAILWGLDHGMKPDPPDRDTP